MLHMAIDIGCPPPPSQNPLSCNSRSYVPSAYSTYVPAWSEYYDYAAQAQTTIRPLRPHAKGPLVFGLYIYTNVTPTLSVPFLSLIIPLYYCYHYSFFFFRVQPTDTFLSEHQQQQLALFDTHSTPP
jgi:hypothetical protein